MGKRLELATKLSLIGSLVISGCDGVITISPRSVEAKTTPMVAPLPDSVASQEALSPAPILGEPAEATLAAMVRETLTARPTNTATSTPETPTATVTATETSTPELPTEIPIEVSTLGITEANYNGANLIFNRMELSDELTILDPVTGDVDYYRGKFVYKSYYLYFYSDIVDLRVNNKVITNTVWGKFTFVGENDEVVVKEGNLNNKEFGGWLASGPKNKFGGLVVSLRDYPENMRLVQFDMASGKSDKDNAVTLWQAGN